MDFFPFLLYLVVVPRETLHGNLYGPFAGPARFVSEFDG